MCTYQQFVVDRLDDNLFGRVLSYIETQFQFLLLTIFLNEWRVQAGQPVAGGFADEAVERVELPPEFSAEIVLFDGISRTSDTSVTDKAADEDCLLLLAV